MTNGFIPVTAELSCITRYDYYIQCKLLIHIHMCMCVGVGVYLLQLNSRGYFLAFSNYNLFCDKIKATPGFAIPYYPLVIQIASKKMHIEEWKL